MYTPKKKNTEATPKAKPGDFSLLLHSATKKKEIGFITENMAAPQVIKIMKEIKEYFRYHESEKEYPIGYSEMFSLDDKKLERPSPVLKKYLTRDMPKELRDQADMDQEEYIVMIRRENVKIAADNQGIVSAFEQKLIHCDHQACAIILGQIHDTCQRKMKRYPGGEEIMISNDPVKIFLLIKSALLNYDAHGTSDENSIAIRRKYDSCRQTAGDDIINYNLKFESCYLALESDYILRGRSKESLPPVGEQIALFISGLWYDRFKQFRDEYRTNTARFEHLKTLQDVMAYVEDWEKKIYGSSKAKPAFHNSTPSSDRAIFTVSKAKGKSSDEKDYSNYKCFICGKTGHPYFICPKKKQGDPEQKAMVEKAIAKIKESKVSKAENENDSNQKESSNSKRKN